MLAKSKTAITIAAIIIIIVVAFAVYSILTYPKVSVMSQISFSVGADSKVSPFSQPFLDDKVQIQVAVQNGAALWRAQILNGTNVIWEHTAAQGQQTSYDSGWLELQAGSYNFTFGTIGVGSLNAQVTVSSKGGFW